MRYTIFKVRWGYFGLLGGENGVFGSWLPVRDRKKLEAAILRGWPGARYENGVFKKAQQLISAYFEGDCVSFNRDIPIVLGDGTGSFARRVLAECRRVRFGQTISYGELAKKAGAAGAARAVGNALGRNRLPLIIPCHRVVCSNGKVGGFSAMGGVGLKKKMLAMEEKAVETA